MVRKTINILTDEANAVTNPVNTMQASDSMKAMRLPCLSAKTDQNIAPKSIPSIPGRETRGDRKGSPSDVSE